MGGNMEYQKEKKRTGAKFGCIFLLCFALLLSAWAVKEKDGDRNTLPEA